MSNEVYVKAVEVFASGSAFDGEKLSATSVGWMPMVNARGTLSKDGPVHPICAAIQEFDNWFRFDADQFAAYGLTSEAAAMALWERSTPTGQVSSLFFAPSSAVEQAKIDRLFRKLPVEPQEAPGLAIDDDGYITDFE